MKISIIEEHIKKIIPNSTITVVDTNGSGDHFSVMVISDVFDGLSLINRHKLIYKALNKFLNNEIHALQIKTITNKEYSNE